MSSLQQPPAMVTGQQAYMDRPAHGSVGPVIGVLAVIVVLGAVAVIIGRLCTGGSVMGRGQYDFERWFETKCGSCVNGMIELPQPPVAAAAAENCGSGGPSPAAEPEPAPQETKEEEEVGNQQNGESTRKS